MVIPEGYKQTEVGVIPEDWEIKILSALSDGGMQNGVFYESSRKGTGIGIVNVKDLYENAPIRKNSLEKFDATGSEIERFRVNSGDLFFTRSSIVPTGIAHTNWYEDDTDNPTVFDSHVIRFRTDKNQVVPMYLYLQCISNSSRSYFIANAKTATMTTIDQKVLGECPIAVAPFHEQKAISASISEMNALISQTEKLLGKKKAIKQGAMQELLTGRRRLPGFNGEWCTKILERVSPLQRGFDLTQSQICNGEYPVVYSNGIASMHKEALVKGPGVVTGRSGTIGKVHFINGDFWPHNTTLWVTDFKGNDPLFIYYLLKTVNWNDYMTGSGVPTLNRNDVHKKEMRLPVDISEQKAIAGFLSEMDDYIKSLEQKLAKYQQLKQGMMQQLLTGKIRLV